MNHLKFRQARPGVTSDYCNAKIIATGITIISTFYLMPGLGQGLTGLPWRDIGLL
jgi:hypothetical protein